MTIVRDSHLNVYEVPDEILTQLCESQTIVYDNEGLEYGLSTNDLSEYKLSDEEACSHDEVVLVKLLTSSKVHFQAPRRSSRCCNVGDVVTWCNGWA